jgi:hypothetical protein
MLHEVGGTVVDVDIERATLLDVLLTYESDTRNES